MGSSSTQQQPIQSQTQTKDPWAPSQPYLLQGMSSAAGLFNEGQAGGYAPYTGSTVADVNPWQQQGQNTAYNLAASEPYGSTNLGDARNLADMMVKNEGLSPQLQTLLQQQQGQQNPYLQSILDTNNRRIGDRVNASMSGAGRYGSGQHTDVMSRALAESADPVLAQDYQQRQAMQQSILEGGLQRAGQYSQLIPNLDQARFANSGTLMDLGQFYSNRAQGQLNSDIQQYNATQAYPWENLARYNAIATGAGALGGSQVTGTSGFFQQPTTMQRLFGGAAAGAGIGGSFGGPAGAGIGAAGGGLLGLLG